MALRKISASFIKQACVKSWLTGPGPRVLAAGQMQVATLKPTWGEKYPYPEPYVDDGQMFGTVKDVQDLSSLERLNENSKVVVIEGNVGVGKHDFGKKLAREFDLKFFPGVTGEEIFNYNGFDIRQLDHLLPKDGRCYDVKRFLSEEMPQSGKSGRLQHKFLEARLDNYGKALRHVLNTGQGVVIVRSPYSDMVFAQAIRQLRWVTRDYFRFYKEMHPHIVCSVLQPHLIVYLDASVEECMKRIKARKDPREEGNEEILSQFLPAVEVAYKSTWLDIHRRYSEVIEIDWEEVGTDADMDVIAEEIATLQLHAEHNDEVRFQEWFAMIEDELFYYRNRLSDKTQVEDTFQTDFYVNCPEVFPDLAVQEEVNSIYSRHPAFYGDVKTNPKLGGKSKLWHLF